MTPPSPSPVGLSHETIYWHRHLPPLSATFIGEHTIEAASAHVPDTLVHGSDLWNGCYENLTRETTCRLEQEIARMGGTYAHITGESIYPRHDAASGDAWLHGCFTYELYRG